MRRFRGKARRRWTKLAFVACRAASSSVHRPVAYARENAMHPGVTNNPAGLRGINAFPDTHKSGSGDMPASGRLHSGRPATIRSVLWRGRRGRVAEGGALLKHYTSKAYRGFESLRLRHNLLILNDNFIIPDELRTCPGVSAGYARPDCAAGRGDRFGAVVTPLHRQRSPIRFSVVPLATEGIPMLLQFEGLERGIHRRGRRRVASPLFQPKKTGSKRSRLSRSIVCCQLWYRGPAELQAPCSRTGDRSPCEGFRMTAGP